MDMRVVLMGCIVLLLQRAISGMRSTCGFVAGSVAATNHRSHTNRSGRQESAACRLQTTTWALKRPDPCDDEDEAPAAPGSRNQGIPTRLKEKIATTREGEGLGSSLLLYFAFGANMNPSILSTKRGIKPLRSFPAEATAFATTSSRKDGTGVEEGLCMCFCHRAGYATLAPKPGPPQSWEASPGTHGVVHVITSTELKKIATSENGYRKRMVEVQTPTGERDVAVCFVSDPSQTLPTSVPPTSRYLALLQDGAAYHGVNERYSRWLGQLPCVPSEQEATSPERINTPSKTATDAVVTVACVTALGAAFVALGAR